MDCVFCKIVNGELSSNKVYEDDKYLAFENINPEAKTHYLIIPKKHLESFHLLDDIEDLELVKGCYDIAYKLIKQNNMKGANLLINSGKEHGQEVFHIHLHLMSNL
ncbi:HIT domain-containing protein [Candidatus Vampirococcus lugosii]|uniref:Bis(5'-nucleosyl)-tetraphosphatase (Asymmetrical) n=1 Tax=Candidatus Vampirococcus lugosii TaxID=2789015 RepID=A0ABS5QMB6_9BACT|nr:Bis(5'-nucleosyl)-tetraphosphatase (asymmetrical) [Candidatus Vampirococcus lugosii]